MIIKKHTQSFALVLLLATGAVSLHAQNDTNAPPAQPAARIQTNAPPAKPKAVWKSSAAVGLTMTSGNSEMTLATVSAGTSGKWDHSELSFGADGAYGQSKTQGQTNTTMTAQLLHGFTQYNWLIGDRFYGLGRVEGKHDGIADLRYRVALNLGVGYYFVKNTNTDLSAEVGPGYVFQELGTNATEYASLRVGEKFHQALSDRARLWQTFEWSPQVDKFDNYVADAEIGIEADLTKDKKLGLRTFVTDTFVKEPAPGRKQNDLTWVTAIAYKF